MSNHCLFSETGVETGHGVTKVHIQESTSERPGCCGGCRAGELPGARVQPSPAPLTLPVMLGHCLQGCSVPAAGLPDRAFPLLRGSSGSPAGAGRERGRAALLPGSWRSVEVGRRRERDRDGATLFTLFTLFTLREVSLRKGGGRQTCPGWLVAAWSGTTPREGLLSALCVNKDNKDGLFLAHLGWGWGMGNGLGRERTHRARVR